MKTLIFVIIVFICQPANADLVSITVSAKAARTISTTRPNDYLLTLPDRAYSSLLKELYFNVYTYRGPTQVMIHNGTKVLCYFETTGVNDVTSTPWILFVGTRQECQAEIVRLGLVVDPGISGLQIKQ